MKNKLLKYAACTFTLVGIGGIAGAIESGTSPIIATILTLTGVACMILLAADEEKKVEQEKEIKGIFERNGAK